MADTFLFKQDISYGRHFLFKDKDAVIMLAAIILDRGVA
jgi:hypothetical protein